MNYPVTELQLAILDVLWSKGEAAVLEIHDELRKERRVAQSTISTLLGRLAERGLVAYREDGRRHVYRATVERGELRRAMTAGFLAHTRPLFGSDLGVLVSHLVGEGDVTPEEIEEARSILAEMERRLGADGDDGDGA